MPARFNPLSTIAEPPAAEAHGKHDIGTRHTCARLAAIRVPVLDTSYDRMATYNHHELTLSQFDATVRHEHLRA
jgi:hypothetical protein